MSDTPRFSFEIPETVTPGTREKLGNGVGGGGGAFTETEVQLCPSVGNTSTLLIAVTEEPTISNGVGRSEGI